MIANRTRCALYAALLFAVSCSSSAKKTLVDSPKRKTDNAKPAPTEPPTTLGSPTPGGTPPAPGGAGLPRGNILNASYDLKMTLGGIGFCQGDIQMQLNSDLGRTGQAFQMPRACIKCLGLMIDITQLLGGLSPSAGTDPVPADRRIDVIDYAFHMRQVGRVSYSEPGVPLFPSFLATEPRILRSLRVTRAISLQNSETNESGSGTYTLEVIGFGNNYYAPAIGLTFPNTMSFVVTHTGFHTVKRKLKNILVDRLETKISLDPIAIPYLSADLKLDKALEGMKQARAAGEALDLSGGSCGQNPGFIQSIAGQATGDGGGILAGLFGGDSPIGELITKLVAKLIDIKIELNLRQMEGVDAASMRDFEEEGIEEFRD